MARQEIDLTTPQPNGKMGEPTKSAWEKVNSMTLELYEASDGMQRFQSGLYSARPAASSQSNGSIYLATDVQEQYIASSGVWQVMPSGGSELGYAQISSSYVVSAAALTDVPGLSVTCLTGERPVTVNFGGLVANAADFMLLWLVVDGNRRGRIMNPNNALAGSAATGSYNSRYRSVRVSGLTPGVSHTFKIQSQLVQGSGTLVGNIYGISTEADYFSIRVMTS